ncbi:putative uncharacterized protein CXorf58 homolog isoform X2 [Tachyglossus aculeatus]|uniref:putative uncharacterized protein CXorf58 homolog isoform X2 n=1 Tax=Tachyglossus aculeatus TaxID=9261 RepID=UPI0018F6A2F0|nr:putative uncharacterized protein CXorf58 homolog isoform X2 [Tachyglossus aculeatus]
MTTSPVSSLTSIPGNESGVLDPETHLGKFLNPDTLKTLQRELAATMIQRAWWSYRDQSLFQLLKHTICAAENCVTHEILKKVSPLEADLAKDPSMQCKIRFRFGGERFPPFIVFKIFRHPGGCGSKYISGKKTFRPTCEAMVDACKLMGNRKYYNQMIQDQLQYQKHKIADEIDVVTLKDYMQYASYLDETPAYLGGRNNCWRRLSLENFPRAMIVYDIVSYAQSGTISGRLQRQLKFLLQRPSDEEMKRHQAALVSQIRCSSPSSSPSSSPRSRQGPGHPRHLGRRSRQARQKIAKMKEAFRRDQEGRPKPHPKVPTAEGHPVAPPASGAEEGQVAPSDEDWEQEVTELYAWSQELRLEDTTTP